MARSKILEKGFATLRRRHPQIDPRAYFFVLTALRRSAKNLPKRRHVTGRELANAVRILALDRFGLTARQVLEQWGIRSTEDIGIAVFALIDQGLLVKGEEDRPDDFVNVFDFEEAFETNYPWNAYPGRVDS